VVDLVQEKQHTKIRGCKTTPTTRTNTLGENMDLFNNKRIKELEQRMNSLERNIIQIRSNDLRVTGNKVSSSKHYTPLFSIQTAVEKIMQYLNISLTQHHTMEHVTIQKNTPAPGIATMSTNSDE